METRHREASHGRGRGWLRALVLVGVALAGCAGPVESVEEEIEEARQELGGACSVSEGNAFADQTCTNCGGYTRSLYVDGYAGSDSNPGTSSAPLKSINTAILEAEPDTVIYVKPLPSTYQNGEYAECLDFAPTRSKAFSYTAPLKLTRWGTVNPSLNPAGDCRVISSANSMGGKGYIVVEYMNVRGWGGSDDTIFFYGTRSADFSVFTYVSWIVIRNNNIQGADYDGVKLTICDKCFVMNNTMKYWGQGGMGEAMDCVACKNGVTANNAITEGNGYGGVIYKGGSIDSCVIGNTIDTNLQHAVRLGSTTDWGWITPEGRTGRYEGKNLSARDNWLSSTQSPAFFSGCDTCEATSNQELIGATTSLKDARFQDSSAPDATGATRTWTTRNSRVQYNCSGDASLVECSYATGGSNNTCTPNGSGC
jgi:Right handed beta helix region